MRGVSRNSEIIQEQQSAYERSLIADQQKELEKQRLSNAAQRVVLYEKRRQLQRENYTAQVAAQVEPTSDNCENLQTRFGELNCREVREI
jgi:uncharacterized protein YeaC (DUF1315 family)